MRAYPFLLAATLALLIAFPARAAEKPRAAQANQTRRVWTNEDLDLLRARGLISIVGQAPETAPQAAAAPSEPARYTSRLEDPEWYAKQAADLQAELDKRTAALQEAQMGLAQAAKGNTQAGITFGKKNAGITPEAGIANLKASVQEIQSQLDELSDLARQSNVSPGVLRG